MGPFGERRSLDKQTFGGQIELAWYQMLTLDRSYTGISKIRSICGPIQTRSAPNPHVGIDLLLIGVDAVLKNIVHSHRCSCALGLYETVGEGNRT